MLTAGLTRLRADDAGTSLVELLVAMVLATICGAATLLVFSSSNDAVNDTSDALLGTGNARATLLTWQSLIQAADAPQTDTTCSVGATAHRFEWITARETLFYSNLDNKSATAATCTPPTMVWLALRNGALLEARYTVTPGQTTYNRTLCRVLGLAQHATVSASTLFTPNPGQMLSTVDYGSAFASTTPFAAVTGCANTPASVSAASVSNGTTTALSQVTSVGIDFTVADASGKHTQSYDTTVTVLGGTT
ncbi:MAG: hypothetical protein ACTHMS_04345 [Jatrophihabitans sp.]|uniref:hypothetical protein n=1 Tax=Jatrophihabitans sp. TaxID=1932789 RepID=UPI003F8030FA